MGSITTKQLLQNMRFAFSWWVLSPSPCKQRVKTSTLYFLNATILTVLDGRLESSLAVTFIAQPHQNSKQRKQQNQSNNQPAQVPSTHRCATGSHFAFQFSILLRFFQSIFNAFSTISCRPIRHLVEQSCGRC